MKPKTVFLDQLTNPELEDFLRQHHTVFIPVGATEQHGPHGPHGTDVFLPREIARRVPEQLGNALVAPALPNTLSYPHRGFAGEFSPGLTLKPCSAKPRCVRRGLAPAAGRRR